MIIRWASLGSRRMISGQMFSEYSRGPDPGELPVSKSQFDLVIKLGELGSALSVDQEAEPVRQVTILPLTLLRDPELQNRENENDDRRST